MAGVRITCQAAREGCLAYLDTLRVLSPARRKRLRQRLLFASARTVADRYWTAYWAGRERYTGRARLARRRWATPWEEMCHSLERLACEPAFFKQYYAPLGQAA